MEFVNIPSLKKTHFDTYPDDAIALAKRFFRWRCERENERLGKVRFTEDELAKVIASHAEMTGIYAGTLNRPDEDRLGSVRLLGFVEQEKVDLSLYKEIELELADLLIQAELQFHIIYHDHHKGISPLEFRFPIFEKVWEQTCSKVSNVSAYGTN